ncbi:hypothetical protein PGT21_025345 [Puccinia graminis f. sp. tritici]|uniref:Uncharacterized protein n=2 Tax=Puccinia graminis f. sp. tritici TaxID=56615 RepID=H6QNT8_PUCGT|nr:uncharacterized protein PGTG_20646 [Puccinia graminis f. sp. tritici CRL 75-36-700-3]EHS62526.1 hypothetical protein PGTG_20646 [Puccinia graminis f. sp. tritici CRL 75-36-700-3]KAA1114850.1 hypothetical protein PGT21_025345 [Puccinia graminis f. sp. tritici]KAA1127030.1 hypothetical protein PGTUg99_010042 [Puccinia graminis f. sp. tritici]
MSLIDCLEQELYARSVPSAPTADFIKQAEARIELDQEGQRDPRTPSATEQSLSGQAPRRNCGLE